MADGPLDIRQVQSKQRVQIQVKSVGLKDRRKIQLSPVWNEL